MLPAVAALYASKKMEDLHTLIRSYTRYISILVMPIAFGLAAVMEIPLRIFGEDYVSWNDARRHSVCCLRFDCTRRCLRECVNCFREVAMVHRSQPAWTSRTFRCYGHLDSDSRVERTSTRKSQPHDNCHNNLCFGNPQDGSFEFDWRAYLVSIACSTVMAVVVFISLSSLHTFHTKIAGLPFLVVLGIGTYLGSMRVCHLLSTSDVDFIRNFTPRRFHRYLPIIAKLAGVKYVPNEQT